VRRDLYGDPNSNQWPSEKMTVIHDNGSGFSKVWADALRDALPAVETTFQPTQANVPDQNSLTENSNKQVRSAMRRIAQANRATHESDGKQQAGKKKRFESYWYGPGGIYFKHMQKAVNERPDAPLGRLPPVKVWDAYNAL
jgi:hypothetical protein